MPTKILRWIPAFALVIACVDPVYINVSLPGNTVIVDGSITDEPGPYTVKLTHAFALDADTTRNRPVAGAKIVLHSDRGESEELVEDTLGVYYTTGAIRGTVGISYHITVTMPDGTSFESEPDLLNATGKIRAINYVYEARTVTKPWGVLPADVFSVYVDGDAAASEDGHSYARWRFSGTYKTETNPEKHVTISLGVEYKTPWPCSGWVVDPGPNGGMLRQDTVCICCTCWIEQFENTPHLSDSELVSDGEFRNVKVAEVPITRATFIEKYYVRIEQLAITKNAFDFFKITRAQKENNTNLFQPPPGRHVGNILSDNSYNVIGLFWAAGVTSDAIFIPREAVPYTPARDTIPFPCTNYAHSTTTRPDFWD